MICLVMENLTHHEINTTDLAAANVSSYSLLLLLKNNPLAPSSGGGGSNGPQCFHWDLLVRILLNSILAVLGIVGNR